MSDHHGLANRCLQPLGHISERGNHYSFGASGSNRGSESAESSESKGERRGPERGPTPASRYAVEWAAIPSRATGQSVPTGADGGAKPGATVVPEVVTPFERVLALMINTLPANPKARERFERACDKAIDVGDDPLLRLLAGGVR